MNFQVTVLKILVSYPDGFALMAELKRDMAILATSGREWTERTKRLASGVPNLDIFSQRTGERLLRRLDPNSEVSIKPYVDDDLPTLDLTVPAVRTVDPERTF